MNIVIASGILTICLTVVIGAYIYAKSGLPLETAISNAIGMGLKSLFVMLFAAAIVASFLSITAIGIVAATDISLETLQKPFPVLMALSNPIATFYYFYRVVQDSGQQQVEEVTPKKEKGNDRFSIYVLALCFIGFMVFLDILEEDEKPKNTANTVKQNTPSTVQASHSQSLSAGYRPLAPTQPVYTPTYNYSPNLTFHGYDCTVDCSGHEAGYTWAEDNGITDTFDCDGNSNSFNEGCTAYVDENY